LFINCNWFPYYPVVVVALASPPPPESHCSPWRCGRLRLPPASAALSGLRPSGHGLRGTPASWPGPWTVGALGLHPDLV